MRIEVKGRNVIVGDELRERVRRRFERMSKQVSPLAELDVELFEERNPSIRDAHVAEVTLRLKGVTLRARSAADNMPHALNLAADELSRQVKRYRDKRRGPRAGSRVAQRMPAAAAAEGATAIP